MSLFLWAITSALAGFLFGFDTVVISGAEGRSGAVEAEQRCHAQVAMASALWHGVGLARRWIARWSLGTQKTLIWVGVLYFVSAVWSGIAPEVWSLIIARFIGGLGVGISTVAAPLYITEISPPDRRGRRRAGMFQFNIVFGILVAFVSNHSSRNRRTRGGGCWHHGRAVADLHFRVFRHSESPRWFLTRKGDRAGGWRC